MMYSCTKVLEEVCSWFVNALDLDTGVLQIQHGSGWRDYGKPTSEQRTRRQLEAIASESLGIRPDITMEALEDIRKHNVIVRGSAGEIAWHRAMAAAAARTGQALTEREQEVWGALDIKTDA